MDFWSSFQVQVERHATPEETKAPEQLPTASTFINMATSVPSGLRTVLEHILTIWHVRFEAAHNTV